MEKTSMKEVGEVEKGKVGEGRRSGEGRRGGRGRKREGRSVILFCASAVNITSAEDCKFDS